MIMRKWITAGVLLLLILTLVFLFEARRSRVEPLPKNGSAGSSVPASPGGHTLLPQTEVSTYIRVYLVNPRIAVQSWEPTQSDVDALEADLAQIVNLRESGWDHSRRIENPDQYFRQYLAIILSGKKQIFVNASSQIENDGSSEWHHQLQVVVDGGKCFWQAYYDPITRKFSNLQPNARA